MTRSSAALKTNQKNYSGTSRVLEMKHQTSNQFSIYIKQRCINWQHISLFQIKFCMQNLLLDSGTDKRMRNNLVFLTKKLIAYCIFISRRNCQWKKSEPKAILMLKK